MPPMPPLGFIRSYYCLRVDIRSYYASINHRLLIKQLTKHFDDPIIRKYLADIVTVGVDCGGQVILPTQGIPRQCALSPFFGALYLSALDKAFTQQHQGYFYLRYMDDIIILAETKRQYAKARKRLFAILKELRLQISPHKTRMGALQSGAQNGFHFLGVNFEVSRNPQRKTQEARSVKVNVHRRTPRRALCRIKAMRQDAVHPAHMQRYLTRWASWWHHVVGLSVVDLIFIWVCEAAGDTSDVMWLGRGLLPLKWLQQTLTKMTIV
jgi:RNA-directed DNA polymerase